MCGIVYAKSLADRPVNRTIAKKYLAQRSRGTDGFGFYVPQTDRLTHNPREGRILSLLRRQRKAREILFHHRMPTSTSNVRNACHPFSTKDYFEHNYVVVHNGVLWNELELKPAHKKRGIEYISEQEDGSFNDSEALAYDIAQYLEGEVDFISARGSIAFIAIQRDKKGTPLAVYFGRNHGNPLVMHRSKKEFTLSSEGRGILIDPDQMYKFDYETEVVTKEYCRFPSGTSGYSTSGQSYWKNDDFYPELTEEEWRGIYSDIDTEIESRESRQREARYKGEIKREATRLMEENFGILEQAILVGGEELASLTRIREGLRPMVEVSNTASDEEIDKYYRLGNRIYYLDKAVELLEVEGRVRNELGFRYDPEADYYTRAVPSNGFHPYPTD